MSLGRLGDALGDWRPQGGSGAGSGDGDPLAAIRAAWPGIVGGDVARSAQPAAIAGTALVVMTASSAWSHQLAFLGPQIVQAVAQLPEGRTIDRLRFRVGTVRPPRRGPTGAGRRSAAGVPGRPAQAAPATETPAAALARFRSAVERARSAHAAAGGAFCPVCGAFTETERPCVPCADGARTARLGAAERLLFEAPWLSSEGVLALVPGLDAGEYDAARRRLLRAWWDEMSLAARRAKVRGAPAPDRSRLRKLASSYVLLETRIDPNRLELDGAIRRNALRDLFDFIRSIELAEEN